MSEIAVVGMSPGNSYFKEEVVNSLLEKVITKFGEAIILIADIPSISTYVALGYPQNIARREKALPQGNNLRNKVLRAKSTLNYTDKQVRIIDWENEVESNPIYKEKYEKVLELYNSNNDFRTSANEATKEVLEYSKKDIANLEDAIKTAVHYLLSEIAFMEFMPSYLGVDKATYIYHRDWPVYESYIAGEFDADPKAYLGFEIVKT